MPRSLTLVALLSFAILRAPSALAQAVPTVPDLVFANLGGHDLKLDLYLPPSGTGPFPCVVWIHGGGWSSGTKWPVQGGTLELLGRGIAVASVEYRLTSQAGQFGLFPVTFPAQIEDVKGAVRWLRAHAATYALDPARFGSWGDSSGGHLSALLGTSGGALALEGITGGNLTFSSRVQAAADWFGATDLLNMNLDVTVPPGSTIDHDAPGSYESHLIGFDLPGQGIGVLRANQSNPLPPFPFFVNLVNQANPIRWVDPSDPPFFIGHGTLDTLVPKMQSIKLAAALSADGVPYTYDQASGLGHGLNSPHAVAVQLFFEQVFLGAVDISSFCDADPSGLTCPCNNVGDEGHGCANSLAASNGALLVAGGGRLPSSMTLEAIGMIPNALCFFLQGDEDLAAAQPFGDGLSCIGGTQVRLCTKIAGLGGALYPYFDAGEPSIPDRSAALGEPIPPGSRRSYQVYYRDGAPNYCPSPQGQSFNVTNGMHISWP